MAARNRTCHHLVPSVHVSMPNPQQLQRLPFHNLRTTYASRLAEAGISEVQIARLLGHSRTTVTKQHYIAAGAVPDAVLETVERMVG